MAWPTRDFNGPHDTLRFYPWPRNHVAGISKRGEALSQEVSTWPVRAFVF